MGVKYYHKNVLVFFKNVTSNASIHYDDQNSVDFRLKQQSLKKFRTELSSSHNPKYFSTAEELAQEVKNALIPIYRAGVRALLTREEDHLREIDRLNQENQRLSSVLPNHFSDSSILDFASSERGYGLVGATRDLTNKRSDPAAFGLTRSIRGGLAKK